MSARGKNNQKQIRSVSSHAYVKEEPYITISESRFRNMLLDMFEQGFDSHKTEKQALPIVTSISGTTFVTCLFPKLTGAFKDDLIINGNKIISANNLDRLCTILTFAGLLTLLVCFGIRIFSKKEKTDAPHDIRDRCVEKVMESLPNRIGDNETGNSNDDSERKGNDSESVS